MSSRLARSLPLSRRDLLKYVLSGAAVAVLPGQTYAANAMTKNIPTTGESIPAIGLGTWQTFDVGESSTERAPIAQVLKAFVDHGGKVVDSSPMYGRSEEVVGDLAVKLGVDKKLFLATKVWTRGRSAGIRQMEESFSRLRAERIDLMQIHNLVDYETHLATLREWKAKGRVRYIGITHYTASAHAELARVIKSEKLDFIQVNYSIAESEADRRLLPLARDLGVAVIANRPFAGSNLFQHVRGKTLPSWAKEIDCASWAQLFLKFVVGHPAVTCAIPATSKAKHLVDNMQAGTGALPDAKFRQRIQDYVEKL